MNLVQHFCILRLARTSGNPATRDHTKRSRIVFNACETTVRVPSVPSVGVSPMASVGKAHSFPPAQSTETKWQLRQELCSSGGMIPIENEIVDAGIDDEAIEV